MKGPIPDHAPNIPRTPKEAFLDEMDAIIPWKEPAQVIKLVCPESRKIGRRTVSVEFLWRNYFIQY